MCTTNTNCTQSRNCTWVRAQIGHIIESPVPHPGAKVLKAHSPDDVSVNTASVWPPTVCMVNGCSRGADTVLLSTPPYTVSSSFKVKDTCREHRCCFILKKQQQQQQQYIRNQHNFFILIHINKTVWWRHACNEVYLLPYLPLLFLGFLSFNTKKTKGELNKVFHKQPLKTQYSRFVQLGCRLLNYQKLTSLNPELDQSLSLLLGGVDILYCTSV